MYKILFVSYFIVTSQLLYSSTSDYEIIGRTATRIEWYGINPNNGYATSMVKEEIERNVNFISIVFYVDRPIDEPFLRLIPNMCATPISNSRCDGKISQLIYFAQYRNNNFQEKRSIKNYLSQLLGDKYPGLDTQYK